MFAEFVDVVRHEINVMILSTIGDFFFDRLNKRLEVDLKRWKIIPGRLESV